MDADALLREIEAFLKEQSQRPKPVRVLDALLRIAGRGRAHLRAWKKIGDVIQTDTALVDLAGNFFILTALAHLEAAALHAAKLFDTHKDAVSVSFLLRTIESDAQETFTANERRAVRDVVASIERRIDELQPVLRKIRTARNIDLAHLDKRNIDLKDEIQTIEAANLLRVFDAVDEIARSLATSSAAFNPGSPPSGDCDFVGPSSLEDLLYFARVAFQDVTIPSPNPRVEKIREWDRLVRDSRAETRRLPDN